MVRAARQARAAGRPADALDAIQCACEAGEGPEAKRLAAALLREAPRLAQPAHAAMILRLVRDPDIDPQSVAAAGWAALLTGIAPETDGAALAGRLESDALALALLQEAPVAWADAERRLAALRRWLLVARAWPSFPRLAAALIRQAALNGGAWWFDAQERELLRAPQSAPFVAAYLPTRVDEASLPASGADAGGDAVTRQYERWPYPRWRRITTAAAERLPDVVARLDPDFRADIPVAARILVAGCGTGRQAADVASRFPDASVTAIDISGPSLDYARAACGRLGLANLAFAKLDLLDVASLGTRFHAIYCAGVLHHMQSPELGWRALAQALHPGGVMRLGLYSRAARLPVTAARQRFADLAGQPVDDDLIRLARRRLLDATDGAARWMARGADFATLESACDLLLHPHEDPFTVPRIGEALAANDMRLLRVVFASPSLARQYETMFPDDPRHADLGGWSAFEKRHPTSFAHMYDFWCGKPA